MAGPKPIIFDEACLQCPICYNLPPGEILQCANGHSFCIECCQNFETNECPVCKYIFLSSHDGVRNRALESVLDSMKFPCLNWNTGCEGLFKRQDFKNHVSSCPFGPIPLCKLVGFRPCEYLMTKSMIPQYLEHLQNEHREDLWIFNKPTSVLPGVFLIDETTWGKPLWFKFKDFENGRGCNVLVLKQVEAVSPDIIDLFVIAVYLGEKKEEASKMFVEVSVEGPESAKIPKMKWSQRVVPFYHVPNESSENRVTYRVRQKANEAYWIEIGVKFDSDMNGEREATEVPKTEEDSKAGPTDVKNDGLEAPVQLKPACTTLKSEETPKSFDEMAWWEKILSLLLTSAVLGAFAFFVIRLLRMWIFK